MTKPADEFGTGGPAGGQEVRRRHLVYVPGYDPRDPDLYRRLSVFELRRFAKLWGVVVDVDRDDVTRTPTPSLSWRARLTAGDARVETTYETLRWDDLVRRDFAAPLLATLVRSLRTGVEVIVTGLLWRIWRAAPWCAVAWFYPMLTVIALFALSVWGGVAIADLVAGHGAPVLGVLVGVALGLALLLGVVAALRRSGSFLVHLIDDGRSQRRYATRADRELDARVDAFAARIREIVEARAADEVLVVGHSSGSFVAIDAIARAYEASPDFARGSNFALLTVGASELLVAFHPRAGWFRERIRRLAIEPSLFWAEVVGPWDTLNFPHRDPVTELGLDVPADRPNPTFRRAFLTKMLGQHSIKSLQKGWRVFRAHFQFVMANEVRGPYDYFSLVLGPWTARSQFARTADGRLMSPKVEPAPPPLPRPDWMPPLPKDHKD
ncbi:hypothetical protein [Chenggangzhangella methanolivorans]|uniref:Alpha/beta hydrolase family protein n=1 Tax=Chenggangzhangella methanolivorans TaxID=1437009 RepID=A0A9E6RBS1_9HYPH|nr:hypothetical protein [Chenggangzhangella methanolivorans]QZO00399.1 hypothetical protein K6K41_01120 [Chenggangzhangella methanolivorans]